MIRIHYYICCIVYTFKSYNVRGISYIYIYMLGTYGNVHLHMTCCSKVVQVSTFAALKSQAYSQPEPQKFNTVLRFDLNI